MKYINTTVLLAFLSIAVSESCNAQGLGLILPMPGQQPVQAEPQKPAVSQPKPRPRPNPYAEQSMPNPYQGRERRHMQHQRQQQRPSNPASKTPTDINPLSIFIPLPSSGQRTKEESIRDNGYSSYKQQIPVDTPVPDGIPTANSEPYASEQSSENSSFDEMFPTNPPAAETANTEEYGSEIPASNQNNNTSADFIPPPPPPAAAAKMTAEETAAVTPPMLTTEEPQIVNTADNTSVTVFPKDTGSAVFMIMKSWQCEDYDASTLLEHAVGVYGQESDDKFMISGLPSGESAYSVSLEEEDITLDELLDIVAQKGGCDWGVDMETKTIYFYPAGVQTGNYDLW